MESKKTETADLDNKRWLFFNIGLAISLFCAVLAFRYKVYDDTSIKNLAKSKNITDEIMEVPPTEQPPPPPPKIQQPKIIEVPDEKEIEEEVEINMDNEITQDSKVEEIIVVQEVEKENSDEVFLIVEEGAMPKGGMNTFYEYVNKKLLGKYPAQARRLKIEGRVYVEFVVNKDGSIQDVKIFKGIGAGCDELAVKAVQEAPSWDPGKQRGRPVRQRMVLPIIFKLGS